MNNKTNFNGSVVLITGAAGNIGRALVHGFADLGADLILVDNKEADLAEFSTRIVLNFGVKVSTFTCDLEDSVSRSALIDNLLKNFSKIDVLINCAAIVASQNLPGWTTPWPSQELESWNRGIEVNLTSVFHLTKGLTPLLMNSDSASVINFGSLYAFLGPDWSLYEGTEMGNSASYSASKGGLLQLTRWLATTLAPNIRVNALSPGGVFRSQDPKFVARFESRTPLRRMATESDLVGPCVFLASSLSGYITGQNLIVDGGWSVW
jgi:NAD(P)-dependent dehydrogenase (short-subunit alcohol dehydrogenase family)